MDVRFIQLNKTKRYLYLIGILIFVASIVIVTSTFVGSAHIPPTKIFDLLICKLKGVYLSSPEAVIMFKIRIPRVVLGFVVGAALSVSGVIMQGLFRNPLVEPYTLGISGGAALGVAILIVSGLSRIFILPIGSGFGAFLVAYIVFKLTSRWKGLGNVVPIVLVGVMFSFICSSAIMLLLSMSKAYKIHKILFWMMGGLYETHPVLLKVACISIIPVSIYLFSKANTLNALSLGDEQAIHLGIDIYKQRRSLFILSTILTGIAVSVSGIIGFVGLVVPHFVRTIAGTDHRILLPASFLLGGSFLVMCDTLARTVISPIELPVGVITGIVGGSLFLYFLMKSKSLYARSYTSSQRSVLRV